MGSFIELYANIPFADWLEVAGPRQTQEAGFERALIDGMAFAQHNSASHVAVAELVQPEKFDAPHGVRQRITQVKRNPRGVIVWVESPHHLHRMGRTGIDFRIS